jgi:tRNA (guanine37-N1)-methyltransferase
MNIHILTLFPSMFQGPFNESIIKRSIEKGIVNIGITDIRDFSTNKHKNVDDYPYGGEAGMVMMAEPIVLAIEHLQKQHHWDEIIFLTPDGETLNQAIANEISLMKNIILICGHYKGIDQRVRDNWITREISMGDYVLSGGELPAMIVTDAIVRLIPGVLNDETSALSDSFQNNLLSPPVYTRPADFRGYKVPDVLLSGHQKKIDEWKHEQALQRTMKRRKDLLDE